MKTQILHSIYKCGKHHSRNGTSGCQKLKGYLGLLRKARILIQIGVQKAYAEKKKAALQDKVRLNAVESD